MLLIDISSTSEVSGYWSIVKGQMSYGMSKVNGQMSNVQGWLVKTFLLSKKEKSYFIENLATLVASGMTIPTAIDAMKFEVRSRGMKNVLGRLKEDIENGFPVWKALGRARVFKGHTVALVRIGEESGKLSENLKIVADQEAKDREFRSKIRSAMMYPIFVMLLTVIIGVSIAWFILPRLTTVFSQLKVELPAITKALIAVGNFLGEYGKTVVPLFVLLLALTIYFTFSFPKTKFIGQKLLFVLPGTKRMVQEIELARFGYLLGTLFDAGLPIIQALDSLHRATVFPNYKKLFMHIRNNVENGDSFQESFASYEGSNKYIPSPIQQMIIAGEQSGNLSKALLRIGKTYEAKVEITTKNLAVILEPVLLVIVWLGVVAVALAVILPIYSLVGGISR